MRGHSGTPIPHRDNELRVTGAGQVITYQLSDEELEKYRSIPKPEDSDKRPLTLRIAKMDSESQRRRANKRYEKEESDKVGKFNLTPDEFIAELKTGKSITQIEGEHGVGSGAAHYYIKKWGIKEQVQELIGKHKKRKEPSSKPTARPEVDKVVKAETGSPWPKNQRSMQIQIVGRSSEIEEELQAMIAYVQATKGLTLRLDVHLVEVSET